MALTKLKCAKICVYGSLSRVMSDTDSSSGSEDGLSALMRKTGSTPQKVSANFPGVKASARSDDLDLIAIPDNSEKVIRTALQDRAIKEDIDAKKLLNDTEKLKIDLLRESLVREMSDNGCENGSETDTARLVENMLRQGGDLYSFKREFYLLNEVPSCPYDRVYNFDITGPNGLEIIEKYNLLYAPFQFTSMDFLRDVDSFLGQCIVDGVSLDASLPQDKFPFEDTLCSLENIQNGTFSFQFKLRHINNNPLIGLTRLSIYIKLRILMSTVDQSIYTVFFAALCDANLCKLYFSELLEFARLIYPLHKSYQPDILALIGITTSLVSIYDYESETLFCLKYASLLRYNILNILQTCMLPDSPSLVKQRIDDAIIEFIEYNNIKDFVESVINLVKIECATLFVSPDLLLEIFKNHFKFRLLHVLVDYDLDPGALKSISGKLTAAKQQYHQLMGQVSFSSYNDLYNQRSQIVQILDEDYTYLDYFQVKYFQLYSTGSGNRFYE